MSDRLRALSLAAKLARRDLRGAAGSFWLLVAGIALGVAAIAAAGSVAGAVLAGVEGQARLAIGGDVSLRLFHAPATPDQAAALDAAGARSETAELRPLVRTPDGRSLLVELKGVNQAYPLYGSVTLSPARPLSDALAPRDGLWGAVADDELMQRLQLRPGDRLRLGAIEVELRGRLLDEPDRSLRAFSLGPRLMIARGALDDTGLAPPGAQVYWYNRVRLHPGTDAARWIADIEARFPHAGWRIVNAADGVPGIERTVQIAQVLLVLVGLSVLLVGGVGVGSATAAHLQRKTASIAVLKSLGATSRLIFAVHLLEVMAAALLGVVLGVAAGAAAPLAVQPLAGDVLPIAAGPQPRALATAAAFGLLTALLFALAPLGRMAQVTPQALFRDLIEPHRRRPRRAVLAAMAVVAVLLFALLLASSALPLAAALFAAAAAAAVLLFLGLGKALGWAAGRISGRGPLLRLALGNLSRPGAATGPVVMALGLSLTVLVAIHLTEGNARHHLATGLPAAAPGTVFLNVPPAAGAAFDDIARSAGAERVQRMPFLHARLSHVAGQPVAQRRIPAEVAWVVRGDRGLSWAALPPPDSEVVAGAWWPADHRGSPLASLDAEVAGKLGIELGDTLTLILLGRPVEVTVANLRRVDWTRLALDFPILLSPPAEPPPHGEVAAVWAPDAALSAIEAAVLTALPETPPIRIAPVLASLSAMVEGAGRALTAAAGVTVVAALLVLAGSIAAGYRRRLREMVLLKVVGARPRQLFAACLAEFLLLGLATAAVASCLGSAAAWAVGRRIMPDRWVFLPQVPLLLSLAALAVMAATALLLARRALASPPATLLRQRFPAE